MQPTQRCLDEDCRVELLDVGSNAEGGHGVKGPERVAALQEVVRVALVQSTRDEENDLCKREGLAMIRAESVENTHVVDHVGVAGGRKRTISLPS